MQLLTLYHTSEEKAIGKQILWAGQQCLQLSRGKHSTGPALPLYQAENRLAQAQLQRQKLLSSPTRMTDLKMKYHVFRLTRPSPQPQKITYAQTAVLGHNSQGQKSLG